MADGKNIKVFLRCRPLRGDENPAVIDLDSHQQIVTVETKEFQFDKVFDPAAPQEDVYEAVVKPLVPQVLEGYDCAVLAYGQTGTGKTYTMEGIIPKAVTQIFELLRESARNFNIKVSFLELYSEDAYDLLSSPEDTTKLRIFDDKRDDKKKSVKIEGLREISVESESDIIELLARGSLRRQTAATLLNACSSRSHSIFTITVEVKTEILEEREITRVGKLNLVDLAGSESIARSGAQNKHARETGNINQSLLTLTRVITAITQKCNHVPYRESKLTRILQDSLGGATRTSMIATISPANDDLVNTLGTLEYASGTRRVKNKPDCNRQLTSRKTSEELEEYKKCFESETEARIRAQAVLDFRDEVTKIEAQHKRTLDEKNTTIRELNEELKMTQFMLKDEKQLLESLRIEFKKSEEELQQQHKRHLEEKDTLIEELRKDMKTLQSLYEGEKRLVEDLGLKFKKREEEFLKKEQEFEEAKADKHPLKIQCPLSPVPKPPPKKLTRRTPARTPAQHEDYLDMTFTGDDEIVQVSAVKKPRRAILAEPKLRQNLTLSGKKKKLKNWGGDIDLSPLSPPVIVTRSRTTRRKLQY